MSTNEASATAYPFPSHTQTTPSTQADSGAIIPNANEQMDNKPTDATSALAEAIDDFLGDLERKFKTVSEEILTKLDDMAERCDRIEAEVLMRDAVGAGTSKSSLEEKSGE